LGLQDLDRLKKATAWMWSLGDYTEVAPRLEPSARQLARALDLGPGVCVLDVAAGNGNFALAAAEQGATVTASDLTARMVGSARCSRYNRSLSPARCFGCAGLVASWRWPTTATAAFCPPS
jgi:SAM-dependent methyltransferase